MAVDALRLHLHLKQDKLLLILLNGLLLQVDYLLRLEGHLLRSQGLSVGAVRANHTRLLETHHHLGVKSILLRNGTEHLLLLLHGLGLSWLLYWLLRTLFLNWLLNHLDWLGLRLSLCHDFSNFGLALLHWGFNRGRLGLLSLFNGGLWLLLLFSFIGLLGSCLVDQLFATTVAAASSATLSAFTVSAASGEIATLCASSAATLLSLSLSNIFLDLRFF